jgi:prepilin peptidase CpaA
MNWAEAARLGLLAGVLAASIYTDVTRGKIYNKLVLPAIPAAFILWGLQGSWGSLIYGLAGMGVGCIGLFLAVLGWIAPGDGKLFVAVGALMGPAFAIWALMLGAIAGGVMAAAVLARQRLLTKWASGTAMAWTARIPVSTVWVERAGFLPYSIAIAVGCVLAWLVTK